MQLTQKIEGEILNVHISGRFTFADHLEFREVIHQLGKSQFTQVMFHLDGLEFIDSAGLGMLLLARDEAAKNKKSLTLCGAAGQVKKMFDLASFQHFFTMI